MGSAGLALVWQRKIASGDSEGARQRVETLPGNRKTGAKIVRLREEKMPHWRQPAWREI